MSDILILQERIKNSILVGESDFREFKSAWEGKPGSKKPRLAKHICQDIAEGLVAFANADGGELLIGVEDDMTVTGIPHTEEEVQQMLNAPHSHVFEGQNLPMIYAQKIQIQDETVLFFQVEKGATEIYQLRDGRAVIRKDKRTVPAKISRLQFERQEVLSREYDRQFVDGATINDLDIPLIQSLANNYLKGMTAEKYLQQLGLAEYSVSGLRLRRAAVLLFARDVSRWHPRSQVRILKVNGNELLPGEKYNVVSDETVAGNIYELASKGWEGLRPFLAQKTEFGAGGKFEQRYSYPEDACREALLNALAHRDYSNSNGIEVYIFDDRLEIKSPGALLSTLRIEDLYALDNRHESRNSKIAYTLNVSKFMRELGEGMKRIFTLMSDLDRKPPELYSNTNWFTVKLFNRPIYTPKQQEFLNLFSKYNLTSNQKKIVLLGMQGEEIAPEDMFRAMNTSDRDIYDKEVTGLRMAGLLQKSRSKSEVTKIFLNQRISRRKIAQYKIVVPT
ncbi:MAG: putative DNA binding domain-containing protein [Saprospiraceae bacterium]|nr:putative DNA binding domain-containing protein [Saprospiraceae bacterium]